MDGVIRLDIGSGHKKEEGWISCDFAVNRKKATLKGGVSETAKPLLPDVECDIAKLPFPDNYADRGRAIHVVEHFYPWEVAGVVAEWVRVLKPGAELAVECPCLDKIVKLYDVPHCPPYLTFWGLYGDPRLEDPLMMHKWCYTETQLVKLLGSVGLVQLRGEPARFHQPVRDMRIVGVKPDERRIVVE